MEVTLTKKINIPDNYLIGYPDGFSRYKHLINETARSKFLDSNQIALVKEIKKILSFSDSNKTVLFITPSGKFRLITPYTATLFYNLIDVKEQAEKDACAHYNELNGDCEDNHSSDGQPITVRETLQTGVIGHFYKGMDKDNECHIFTATLDNYDLFGGCSIFGSDISSTSHPKYIREHGTDSLLDCQRVVSDYVGKPVRLIMNGKGHGVIWLGDL
jgi:hypothetical protein